MKLRLCRIPTFKKTDFMSKEFTWTEYARNMFSEEQIRQAEEIAKEVGEVAVYDQSSPEEQAASLLHLLNSKGYTITKIQ